MSQIIHTYVDFFEQFVETYFLLENQVYVYNHETYKRLKYENVFSTFLESLKEYYYKNKYFYLTRDPMTFNSFNTIMRQIMKKNDITYTNKIKYTSSKYQVEYHIHKTQFDTSIASMQINNCS
jgi:hypothetical protein